jgi:hypothetical protein
MRVPVPVGKPNPVIFVMQSTEDWAAKNTPCPLYGTRTGRILLQGQVRGASHCSSEHRISESGADVPRLRQ